MAQLSITDISVDCANNPAPSVAPDGEILTRSPLPSQARVLLRKDGQPDRRQFKQFEEKQSWDIYGDFAVADICGLVCVVSACDIALVEQHRWYLLKSGQNHYAATGQGFFMHRMILGFQKGDGKQVDHRDGFGLNNWRDNLRSATPGQNLANRRKHKIGLSRFKGVRPVGRKWAAEFRQRQGGGVQRFYLGVFDTEEAAAAAYDAKVTELYGEFARTNLSRPTRHSSGRGEWFLQRDPAEHICDRCDGMEISEMIQNV